MIVTCISWDNIKNLDEVKVYEMLFPSPSKSSIFEGVDYDYVHSELKKTGVNLKLLWNEYRIIVFLRTLFLVSAQNSVSIILSIYNYRMLLII